ncbi:MAG: hypothetical protein KAT91_00065 [Candidatus Aenigmarchaeota archaeon]|nr:hypothetical protein [Candidatus Aenigmarchaeota archaeon]
MKYKTLNIRPLLLIVVLFAILYIPYIDNIPVWWMDESWDSECAWNMLKTTH